MADQHSAISCELRGEPPRGEHFFCRRAGRGGSTQRPPESTFIWLNLTTLVVRKHPHNCGVWQPTVSGRVQPGGNLLSVAGLPLSAPPQLFGRPVSGARRAGGYRLFRPCSGDIQYAVLPPSNSFFAGEQATEPEGSLPCALCDNVASPALSHVTAHHSPSHDSFSTRQPHRRPDCARCTLRLVSVRGRRF
jgi:hypothetical protein